MSEIISTSDNDRATIVSDSGDEQFDRLIGLIAENLAVSSQRVYRHTYEQWRAFARRHQLDLFDLSFEHLAAFLNGHDLASAIRRAWKAHMLRLLDWLEEAPDAGRMVRGAAAGAC